MPGLCLGRACGGAWAEGTSRESGIKWRPGSWTSPRRNTCGMGTGQALLKASASKLGGLLFLPSCGTSQVTSSSAQDGIGRSSGHGGSRSRGMAPKDLYCSSLHTRKCGTSLLQARGPPNFTRAAPRRCHLHPRRVGSGVGTAPRRGSSPAPFRRRAWLSWGSLRLRQLVVEQAFIPLPVIHR